MKRSDEYDCRLWVSQREKWISLQERAGFELVTLLDQQELWQVVHTLIDVGYVIG